MEGGKGKGRGRRGQSETKLPPFHPVTAAGLLLLLLHLSCNPVSLSIPPSSPSTNDSTSSITRLEITL